jgi:integrase/recombinase XerD
MVKHLTIEEVERMIEIAENDRGCERDAAIVRVLADTGLRLGELCSLKHGDVTKEAIYIRAETTKTKSGREIPLTDRAFEALKVLWKCSFKYPFIVSITPRRIQQVIQEIGYLASVPFKVTPHKLRHTFATELITKDVPTRVIQTLLGHSVLSSTQIYTGVTRDNLRRAINKLSGPPETSQSTLKAKPSQGDCD